MKIVLDPQHHRYWIDLYRPLLEFCKDRGCVLSPSYSWQQPFMASRGGGDEVELFGPVTLEDVLAHFDLPDTVEISDRNERWGREAYHFFDRGQGVHFAFEIHSLDEVKALLSKWDEEAAQRVIERENEQKVLDAMRERFDTEPTEH